jgi:hypothetical protein
VGSPMLIEIVRGRIRNLEIQSYVILIMVTIIIVYGFYISGKAPEQTATDIGEIKRTAERAAVDADLSASKLKFMEATAKLDSVFRTMEKQLDRSIADIEGLVKDELVIRSYIFRTDFSYVIADRERYKDLATFTTIYIDFSTPTSCKNMLDIKAKQPLKEYMIYDPTDLIYDYSNLVEKLSFFTVSRKIYSEGRDQTIKLFEPVRQEVLKRMAVAVDEQCQYFRLSPEFKRAGTLVTLMDDLLDRENNYGAAKSSSEPRQTQDNATVVLLLSNRFGPLIVIFFFSSMLVTLYKYNSRLVGFYYARVYALEALDGKTNGTYFGKLVSIFSPDAVDYGRNPKTPIDIAGDVAVKLADKMSKSALSKGEK